MGFMCWTWAQTQWISTWSNPWWWLTKRVAWSSWAVAAMWTDRYQVEVLRMWHNHEPEQDLSNIDICALRVYSPYIYSLSGHVYAIACILRFLCLCLWLWLYIHFNFQHLHNAPCKTPNRPCKIPHLLRQSKLLKYHIFTLFLHLLSLSLSHPYAIFALSFLSAPTVLPSSLTAAVLWTKISWDTDWPSWSKLHHNYIDIWSSANPNVTLVTRTKLYVYNRFLHLFFN